MAMNCSLVSGCFAGFCCAIFGPPLSVFFAGIYRVKVSTRVCCERRESGGLGRRIRTCCCCLLQMRVRMKWSVTACVLDWDYVFLDLNKKK